MIEPCTTLRTIITPIKAITIDARLVAHLREVFGADADERLEELKVEIKHHVKKRHLDNADLQRALIRAVELRRGTKAAGRLIAQSREQENKARAAQRALTKAIASVESMVRKKDGTVAPFFDYLLDPLKRVLAEVDNFWATAAGYDPNGKRRAKAGKPAEYIYEAKAALEKVGIVKVDQNHMLRLLGYFRKTKD
jgi:hypothetical protein